MADMFDGLSTLTLNIQEATQDSDLIKVNPYLNPEITAVHNVMTGVNMDKYIPILGQIEDLGRVDPGNCGVNTFDGSFPVSQKTWVPKLYSERIPLCVDDIPARLKFWRDENIASKRWENIGKPLEQYILDLTGLAVSRAIIRIAEFDDTAAALVANGGNFSAGTNLALFNVQDGMWKQIFTDGAGAQLISRVTIDENSAATKALQMTLADDAAYKIFRQMVESMPPAAMGANNVIQVTKSLWDNWVGFIENKAGQYKPELLQDGSSRSTFRGYNVIVRNDWDRLIKKYHDLGATYYLPHRAVFTDINNIPIGTSDTESFNALDVFYDKVTKKVYIDVAWKQDMVILQEGNMVVAY